MARVYVARYWYDAVESELARLRPERFEFFEALSRSGALLGSGRLLSDEAHGMLLLRAADSAEAARLLDEDPFVRAGVVTSRTLEEWVPTVGTWIDS